MNKKVYGYVIKAPFGYIQLTEDNSVFYTSDIQKASIFSEDTIDRLLNYFRVHCSSNCYDVVVYEWTEK